MDEPLPPPSKLPAILSSEPSPPPPQGRVKFLVVEDNAGSREMVKMLLELEGAEVIVAVDGREGLEAILRERPQVALVDIGLPELDGIQLARCVREALSREQVRLVAMTGYGRSEDRRAVAEAGFDDHLIKPVPVEDLYRILHEAQQHRGPGAR
jgi:CheY-like chemotaxis protein